MEKFNSWFVGVSPWIIQDGNYSDFSQGQDESFALEFGFLEDHKLEVQSKIDCSHLSACHYRIQAQVIAVEKEFWSIDFGVKAYNQNGVPQGVSVGDYVSGNIYLGIDPFFYRDEISKLKNAPSLIYDWSIKKITQETSPLVLNSDRFLVPDMSKQEIKDVLNTDAWSEKNGKESLHYTLLAVPTLSR